MSEGLVVLLNGVEAGVVVQTSRGHLQFTYANRWQDDRAAYPLSLSMPLARVRHEDQAIRPYMEGLLPDNDRVLDMWGRQFGVSPRNPYSLLRHVGEDAAGAVQFVPRARVEGLAREPGSIEWLTEDEVGSRLARLLVDQSEWRAVGDRGFFSLAGAQPKTAFFRAGGQWGIPAGRIPTTHILKPPALDLEAFAENEHLCLRLAGALGLPAVNSELRRFGGQLAIVVERYDRIAARRGIARIHQEDFCQAAAVSPRIKYEAEGGPGVGTVVGLLRENSSDAARDLDTFVAALAMHWAIGASDAHAKNYSILIAPGGQTRLAPLYDLLSVLPYPNRFYAGKIRLAMSVGGENRLWYLRPRHWDRFAESNDLDADRVRARVLDTVSRVPDCLADVCAEARDEGLPPSFLDRFQKALTDHAVRCLSLMHASGD